MLLPLLLQIVTLLPPAPTWRTELDADYLQQVQNLALLDQWSEQATQSLHAHLAGQHVSLGQLLRNGSDSEVRLSAILAAGCCGDSALGYALWRRAGMEQNEAKAIACLLAPRTVPQEVLPMLAWMATNPQRSLPQRATALARLLDADQLSVWPLVRSILRTGTAEDVIAPGADWKRDGRYELPKRILLLSLQNLLQRWNLEPTRFEPNAPWGLQLEQLRALEESMLSATAVTKPEALKPSRAGRKLDQLREQGNPHAIAACTLLLRSSL